MGQLIDVAAVIKDNFRKLSGYYKGMSGYFGDPDTPGKDANEAITGVDLTDLRRAIQSQVKGSASNANISLLASYRDLDSAQAELNLRNLSRQDYYREAASEAGIRQGVWEGNLQDNLYNLTGSRSPEENNGSS